MLLHGHPLNEAREAAGALALNSVWISGCGVNDSPSRPLPADLRIEAERARGRLNSQSQQVASIEQRLAGGENELQEVEKRLAAMEAEVEKHRTSLEEASVNANGARERLRVECISSSAGAPARYRAGSRQIRRACDP